MTTQHFVLTRFNINYPGREAKLRAKPGWLERRFDLFEKYCLPSMAAQASGTFHWLIYFNETTPAVFRHRIDLARKTVPFEPIFVDEFHASRAADDVSARRQGCDRLITTRLDNDDAVSDEYLARVRVAADTFPNRTVINFRAGFALKQGYLFAATDPCNPFSSLVESCDEPETIWATRHSELAQRFTIRQVTSNPSWMQVIHQENVANRIKGRLINSVDISRDFSFVGAAKLQEVSPKAVAFDRFVAHPMRKGREFGIGLARAAKRIMLRQR